MIEDKTYEENGCNDGSLRVHYQAGGRGAEEDDDAGLRWRVSVDGAHPPRVRFKDPRCRSGVLFIFYKIEFYV